MQAIADARLFRHEVLSRSEQDALLRRYAAAAAKHGPESKRAVTIRNQIVIANMRLVGFVAKRFRPPRGMSLEDLHAYGVFGLITAIERFDPERGVQLTTYATWWIRHAIGRAISDLADVVRVPVHAATALSRAAEGRARKSGGARRDVLEGAAAARRVSSLDAPVAAHDGDVRPRGELLSDESAPSALERLEAEEDVARVRAALETLPERLRDVVDQRMAGMTLKEVGDAFPGGGRSRERIRQLETEAFGVLRAELRD